MIVFSANNLPAGRPLMIVTHGMNQDPEYQLDADRMYEMVDTAQFVVAYLRSDGSTWDIGGDNDMNFVKKSIDEMVTRFRIDRNRVYWSGFSMGSMLIYHSMPKMLDIIAAFAPTSGVQFSEQPWNNCKKPVNLIHCHAYGDEVFNYEQYGIRDYVMHFATLAKAKNYKKVPNYYPNGTTWWSGDREMWKNDETGTEVVLFSYNNGGHWPMQGNHREIWNFCKRFSLGPPPIILLSAGLEENAFGLPLTYRAFTYTFDQAVDPTTATATLSGSDGTFQLKADGTELSKDITFIVPEDAKLKEGKHTLRITNMVDERGVKAEPMSFVYYYGLSTEGRRLQNNFQKAFDACVQLYESTADERYAASEKLRTELKTVIDGYAEFTSYSLTEYSNAIEELNQASVPLSKRKQNVDNYYDVYGQAVQLVEEYADNPDVNDQYNYKRLAQAVKTYGPDRVGMDNDTKLERAASTLLTYVEKVKAIVTGISSPEAAHGGVASVVDYALNGKRISAFPGKSVFIRRITYADGTVIVRKQTK